MKVLLAIGVMFAQLFALYYLLTIIGEKYFGSAAKKQAGEHCHHH